MQLDYVIKGLLHFSIHSIYPKIVNKKEVASNYLITIKKIFEYVLPQESVIIILQFNNNINNSL